MSHTKKAAVKKRYLTKIQCVNICFESNFFVEHCIVWHMHTQEIISTTKKVDIVRMDIDKLN